MFDPVRIAQNRWHNLRQSLIMLAGMALLLGAIGWVLAGPAAVVWSAGAGLVILMLGPIAPPAFILRLYRARALAPDQAPELFALTAELTRRAGLSRPPRLYDLPGPIMQAFSVGHPNDAAIAISQGILTRLGMREVAGILAHEISHIAHNDLGVMSIADVMARLTRTFSYIGIFLIILNLPLIAAGQAHVAWFGVGLLTAAPSLSVLLQLALSRAREFDADLGAVELTGDPEALALALTKIEAQQRNPWERHLFPMGRPPQPSLLRSHPGNRERIARLHELIPAPQRWM